MGKAGAGQVAIPSVSSMQGTFIPTQLALPAALPVECRWLSAPAHHYQAATASPGSIQSQRAHLLLQVSQQAVEGLQDGVLHRALLPAHDARQRLQAGGGRMSYM